MHTGARLVAKNCNFDERLALSVQKHIPKPLHAHAFNAQMILFSIFHLALQVYGSPSLEEYLHNPVMSLLARNIERRDFILHAHGRVCGHMGVVVVVCEYTFCVH